jgi:ABC-type glycerol-3-phosphate transport system substrate-binding protein
VLDFWIFGGIDPTAERMKTEFEKANPDIELRYTDIPEDLYVTKLDTAFAAGETPDLVYQYEPRWFKSGIFLPIDETLTSNGIAISDFAATAFSNCRLDGVTYCVGTYTGLYILLYDKDAFDAAGISYPSATKPMSVDRYAEIARQLSKTDPDLSKRVWGGTTGNPAGALDPANLIGENGRRTVGFFDDDATSNAYKVLAQMAVDGSGLTEDLLAAAGRASSTDLLRTHQLAMTLADNQEIAPLLEAGVRIGVAPPYVERDGDPAWIPSWADGIGVTSKSAHPEEAKRYLVWVATEGNRVRGETGTLPLSLKLAKDTGWGAESPELAATVDLAALGRPITFVPGFYSDLMPHFRDAITKIVDNDGQLGTTMTDAAVDAQDALDGAWAQWESIK